MKKSFAIIAAAGLLSAFCLATAASAEEVKTFTLTPIINICEKLGFSYPGKTVIEPCPVGNGNTPSISLSNTSENSFAVNINKLMPRDKNYMISPLSIKTALALAANGAEGETKAELLNTLGITDLDAFNAHSQQLISAFSQNNDVDIEMANAIWLNTDEADGIRFNADYKNNMLAYYNAPAEDVTASDAAGKINDWCSQNTNGKIPSIIDKADFVACLTNAVYFKGSWQTPFKESSTQKAEFKNRDDSKAETDFMNMTEELRYYEDKNLQIAELPYSGNKIAMYVILNNDERTDITPYLDKLSYNDVHISMPKFKIEYDAVLNSAISELGASRAFDSGRAQFGAMFENYDPLTVFYISKAVHKTYIDVNEEGTEAAASTAVMMQKNSIAAEPPKQFIADEPFGFVIWDKENEEILFMGEYAYAN